MLDIYENFTENERKIRDHQRQIEEASQRDPSPERDKSIRILKKLLKQELDTRYNMLKTYSRLVGRNLATWRKRAGITQESLAKEIGVTFITCIRYEKGKVTPQYETLQKMISVFNERGISDVTIDDLFVDDYQEKEKFEVLLTPEERKTVDLMEQMNKTGQEAAFSRVSELSWIPQYKAVEEDVQD